MGNSQSSPPSPPVERRDSLETAREDDTPNSRIKRIQSLEEHPEAESEFTSLSIHRESPLIPSKHYVPPSAEADSKVFVKSGSSSNVLQTSTIPPKLSKRSKSVSPVPFDVSSPQKQNPVVEEFSKKYEIEASSFDEFSINYEMSYSSKIGSGGFSLVLKAKSKSNGQEYAIKCLPLSERLISKGIVNMLKSEIKFLRSLDHPNICKCYEVYLGQRKDFLECRLVLEYLGAGTVYDLLQQRKVLWIEECQYIVKETLKAIHHLHENDCVHRDCKLQNLMLSYSNEISGQKLDVPVVKLIDFGFAIEVKESILSSERLGSFGYTAPEILKREGHGKPADMWSLGVVAYILIFGRSPFGATDTESTAQKVCSGKFEKTFQWHKASKSVQSFISGLLNIDPTKRFDAAGALDHQFVKDIDMESKNLIFCPRSTISDEEKDCTTGTEMCHLDVCRLFFA